MQLAYSLLLIRISIKVKLYKILYILRTIINNYVLVDFIIQNGSGLQLFSSFKDWAENCTHIIRDKEEYITQSITVSWIAQVHSRAVINC